MGKYLRFMGITQAATFGGISQVSANRQADP